MSALPSSVSSAPTTTSQAPGHSPFVPQGPLVQGYEVVIGFETHAQLSTLSKIFSRASTAFGAPPNTQACAVDLALPGALPVMNLGAVERAIEFGLAIGAHIAPRSIFARKNYFYPDLPKGYQISQFEIPVVQGGQVEFLLDSEKRSVRLVRAHLEEDAGKSLHENFVGQTGIDLNRAGTPLLEIVTEPDMRSSAEAVAYARELHKLVRWIGICDGNMQEGSFRCDANVSVRKPGAELGTRREIKNLNSFRFMQQAIDYEVRWQISEIEEGRAIRQATVLFDPDSGETRAMRTKEDAADYRYFPDPDLPPLVIAQEWVDSVKGRLPELPRAMAARFVSTYGLSQYDASQLTQSKELARYFEGVAITCQRPKMAANWVLGEVSAFLNKEQISIDDPQVPVSTALGTLLKKVADGQLSNDAAKTVLQDLWQELVDRTDQASWELADYIDRIERSIKDRDLAQMSDASALEAIIDEVLAANAGNVAQFRAGKDKAFNALVGQIMKASRGKANPQQVNELLRAKLTG